jgi:lysophospholipase L1-like esterase
MAGHTLKDLNEPNSWHSGTPADLKIRTEPRKPAIDPTLGVGVERPAAAKASRHRLVTIGDSLTQGFQSGAIWNTSLSWPRIVAWEMGTDDGFVVPTYRGFGGMPFNLERLLRLLEDRIGPSLDSKWEAARSGFGALGFYEDVASHWLREWRAEIPPARVHNLAAYGWDLCDLLNTTADTLQLEIGADSRYLKSAQARVAYRVLASAKDADGRALTPLGAARELGKDGGIETLVVMIGSNNALGAVTSLKVNWSTDQSYRDPAARREFTVWHPRHFRADFDRVVEELLTIDAEHVILATVPHVTIPPVTRGVSRGGGKVAAGSRYFEFYVRPWISAAEFDWRDDACLTAGQARAIDSAIDDYNDHIAAVVEAQRRNGKDWYLLEIAGLLDRLASRRYIDDASARPKWWDEVGGEYRLPLVLRELGLNSHFFRSDQTGRVDGGFFALDGVHPTTVGYGLIAQEVVNVMHAAGVEFRFGNGPARPGPIAVDFERLLKLDSLLSAPPPLAADLLGLLDRLDTYVDGVFGALGLHFAGP